MNAKTAKIAMTNTPDVAIDDTEFKNHIKATEFDKLRQKLEVLGFDVSNATHTDITALLDELVSTGPNVVALKAASEAIQLKNQLQAQIKAFNDDMDKARAEIYQIISNLKSIQDIDTLAKDVKTMATTVNSLCAQTSKLTGNESYSFMSLIRELNIVDDSYLYDVNTTRMSVQNGYLSSKSNELLRWIGMYMKRMEHRENWGNY